SRHLSAFPTRRSSDLLPVDAPIAGDIWRGGRRSGWRRLCRQAGTVAARSLLPRDLGRHHLPANINDSVTVAAFENRQNSIRVGIDRKSTRLNSSHEWI